MMAGWHRKGKDNKMEPEITIKLDEYHKLLDDSLMLEALREAGVNNWEGYSEAYQIYNEMIEE